MASDLITKLSDLHASGKERCFINVNPLAQRQPTEPG